MPWIVPTTRTTGALTTASIWNTDIVGNLKYIINNSGNLAVVGVGPHALGTAVLSNAQFTLGGTFSGAAGATTVGLFLNPSINVAFNQQGAVAYVSGTLAESGAGTHAFLAGLAVVPPVITNGGATTTTAATLYITGAPTGGSFNYSLYIAAGGVAFGGSFVETGFITPAQITSNQNDYAPTGIATVRVVRLQSDAARTITGLNASQIAGRRILLSNVGGQNITLAHNSGSSSPANCFFCPGAADLILNQQDSVELWYDGTDTRWRVSGY